MRDVLADLEYQEWAHAGQLREDLSALGLPDLLPLPFSSTYRGLSGGRHTTARLMPPEAAPAASQLRTCLIDIQRGHLQMANPEAHFPITRCHFRAPFHLYIESSNSHYLIRMVLFFLMAAIPVHR